MTALMRRMSIHQKLRAIILLATGLALVAACLAFEGFELVAQRRSMIETHAAVAEILGSSLVSAVLREDGDTTRATLAALAAKPDIVDAAVYGASGQRLAGYTRADRAGSPLPDRAPADGSDFRYGHMLAVRGIYREGERVGTVFLRSDLRNLRAMVVREATITAAALAACLVVAYFVAALLQRTIGRPILGLVAVAREFSVAQNTRVRAIKYSDDELGVLVDSFNEMLARIEGDMELERHNEELRGEKARAESEAQAKTAFLANMSHEIRTPMTSILGYIELLFETGVSDQERADFKEIIQRNGEHLLAVINDILDLSKVEAGRLTVELVDCSLVELVNDVAEFARGRAREKGLEFELEYQSGVPDRVETDPTRLRQILMNLLGNAVKFTPAGSVRLVVRALADEPEGEMRIRFDVVDSGIGLSDEQIRIIFNPFAQADSSTTRRFGGTGLGLAISQRLAGILGEGIAVQSAEGRGSTFSFAIRAGDPEGLGQGAESDRLGPEVSATAAPARVLDPGSHTGRVLLAEDGLDNQRLIRSFLERAGFEVDVVGNGRLAVECAMAAAEEGEAFDVLLMDMHMPEMDGYEATERLREAGYARPIVALTARAFKGERDDCLAAGCDDYASKPVDRPALIQLVAEYARKAREDAK